MSDRPPTLPDGLVEVYAQALVLVCRADDHIHRDEGHALEARLAARAGRVVPLDDLLLVEPLDLRGLEARLREMGPFRGHGVAPVELARLIVEDALAVLVEARGHLTEAEAHQLARIATTLGCSADELRAMSAHLAGHLVGWAPR